MQEYVQKLKFLAAMWPVEHLEQLALRAALLVEGSAFKKVARLDPSKLKVANQSGIALLVDAIGGLGGRQSLRSAHEHHLGGGAGVCPSPSINPASRGQEEDLVGT